jgi:hypothetical protein
MTIGVLEAHLAIYEAVSLKDRRRVIKSLKDRLRRRFNVSVAEVGDVENRKSADLAVAMVGNDPRFVHQCLQQVVNYIESNRGATLIDFAIDMH